MGGGGGGATFGQDGGPDEGDGSSSRHVGKADQDVQLGNQVVQEQHRLCVAR